MARNASGVYSLPNSPVVSGTTITATDENVTRNDIASEMTNSLDRNGRGAMLAPLQLFDGVLGQPGLTWGADTNTGIYRSASDTMVLVAGATAIATITTSGVAFVGSISASTSVATPTIDSVAGSLVLKGAGATAITITGADVVGAGKITATTSVVTPIVDSGTTGPLSFRTNNGSKHLEATHNAGTLVNYWSVSGNPTGTGPLLVATGSDANVEAFFNVKGQAHYHFRSRDGTKTQFQILDSAGPNNITVTGGTNPTISTTAGSLAITPAVAMASTLVISGASVSIGTNPATAAGSVLLPYGNSKGVAFRNATNSANIEVIALVLNGTTDNLIIIDGTGTSSGTYWKARSGGAAPNTSDLPSGYATVWRDTGGATTKLYYNNAGSIQSVALT